MSICDYCGNYSNKENFNTTGFLAFTKPTDKFIGEIPENIEGDFCHLCFDKLFEKYVVVYRPEEISKEEALKQS